MTPISTLTKPAGYRSAMAAEPYICAGGAGSVKVAGLKAFPKALHKGLDDRAVLEAELRGLCGSAVSCGALKLARLDFENKKALVPSPLPDMTPQEALILYRELDAQKNIILARKESVSSFIRTIIRPCAISESDKMKMRSFVKAWEAEKRLLLTDGPKGEIFKAKLKYESLKVLSPRSKATSEALDHYESLYRRVDLIQKYLDASIKYLEASHSVTIPDTLTQFYELLAELFQEETHHEKELEALLSRGIEEKIEQARKTFEALQARDRLKFLEARREAIEERLAVVAARSYSPLGAAGSTLPPADETASIGHPFTNVHMLISQADAHWDHSKSKYIDIPFSTKEFRELCTANAELFKPTHNPETDFGSMQKKVVEPGSKIFVRADLHGDLKSLTENLKSLQKQGLLDGSFKCMEGVHLVFLGDYCDRGEHTMELLQLLLTLRMENPEQVSLIRGNHESVKMNISYLKTDLRFKKFLTADLPDGSVKENEENCALLSTVFDTFLLACFIGETTTSGPVHYTMFTHGMFELYADVYGLLHIDAPCANLNVPKAPVGSPLDVKATGTHISIGIYGERKTATGEGYPRGVTELLPSRVRELSSRPAVECFVDIPPTKEKEHRKAKKLEWAVLRISALARLDKRKFVDAGLTAFNWGDMAIADTKSVFSAGTAAPRTKIATLGDRKWEISPEDVKLFFRLNSSEMHKVKLAFRGHEHEKQHHLHDGKIVVTTLPVGTDTEFGSRFTKQLDTGYILTTGPKVKYWTKQVMQRKRGTSDTIVEAPQTILYTGL